MRLTVWAERYKLPARQQTLTLAAMRQKLLILNLKSIGNNMKYSNNSIFVLTILMLIVGSSSYGQKTEPKKRLIEPDQIVSSKLMGRDYQLYISLPTGYSNNDTVSYPVFYVLDGGAVASFEAMDVAHKYLDYDDEIEKVILVGIESGTDIKTWYVNRHFDYTPSLDTAIDKKSAKVYGVPEGSVHSGGAAKFLECLKTEIIPFVDKHYKTTNDRGITGHSYGGLFTAWCFIDARGFFTRYGINSPSPGWNKEQFLNEAVQKFKDSKTWNVPPTKVFASAGGLEVPQILSTMVKFSTYLESRKCQNIDLTWKIFDNDTHLSVVPAMMTKTLTVLYGEK